MGGERMQAALGSVGADMALGWRQGDIERLLIAALVALPFVGAFAILLSWITWWPAAAMVAVAGAVELAAGLWVAGRMARSEAEEEGS